jgi:hypothetical protein
VPQENIFAEGNGELIIAKDFTWSGPSPRLPPSRWRICPQMGENNSYGSDRPIMHNPLVSNFPRSR